MFWQNYKKITDLEPAYRKRLSDKLLEYVEAIEEVNTLPQKNSNQLSKITEVPEKLNYHLS